MAGIPNAPSVYSLTENPALAEQRQKYVVRLMVKYGYITEDQAQSVIKIFSYTVCDLDCSIKVAVFLIAIPTKL